MTEKSFNKAKEILNRIERVRKLRLFTLHNPLIKENTDKSDYIYLSWADNEEGDLKNIIIDWCNEEEKKLQEEFSKL